MKNMSLKYSLVAIIIHSVVFIGGEHDHQEHISIAMEEAGIIPTLLSRAPHLHLTITYPKKVEVDLGNELTPTQVKDEPQVNWDADPKKVYTLIMFDPDAPSKENSTFAGVKHWLVGNILGGDLKTGDVIAEYVGSQPPKGTGLHRYIFLTYEQKDKIPFDEPRSETLSSRLKWSLKNFVKKYDLGDAVAGDFFKAQWDEFEQ